MSDFQNQSCTALMGTQCLGPTYGSREKSGNDGTAERVSEKLSNAYVHYVIVRSDLTHGQQVAQVVHAAGESTPLRVPTSTIAVALAARDEDHLRKISQDLKLADIPHVLIREPIQGREDGEAMSIGIEPTGDRSAIRKVTSSLPCVK